MGHRPQIAMQQRRFAAVLLVAGCLELALSGGGTRTALWLELSPLRTGRIPAATVACHGKVFVFGGETDAAAGSVVPNRYMNDLWMLDPSVAGANWTQLSVDGQPGSPPARVSSSMVCDADTLAPDECGGVFDGDVDETHASGCGQLTIFGVWAPKKLLEQPDASRTATPPVAGPVLAGHTAVTVDSNPDMMVVFGGSTKEGKLSNQTWLFNTVTCLWKLTTPTGSWPSARDFHTAAAVPSSSRFEMWGGVADPTVWTFDQRTHLWSALGPSGLMYESGRAGAILENRALVSFGGLTIDGPKVDYNNRVQYRTNSSSWINATNGGRDVPTGRCYAGLTSVGNAAYMIGGYSRQDSSTTGKRMNDVWRLTFDQ